MKSNWNFNIILVIAAGLKDLCLGAKLERKQDFFDVESYENKRGYGLSEIGKRGFSSSLGFDYSPSSSSDFGLGSSGVITSDFGSTRSSHGGSEEVLSPARDLIPPPAPGVYSTSSTSAPLSSRSNYSKYGRLSSSSPGKDYHSSSTYSQYHSSPHSHHRSQISRRSPHLSRQSASSGHYFDDITTTTSSTSSNGIGSSGGGGRGRYNNPATYGLVSDTEGKLIGYRGSILPGYAESQSIVTSTSSISPPPDSTNFIGSYYAAGPSHISDYPKSKYLSSSLSSSASSSGNRYSGTPVYYPGKEEDHSYRMRDSTSQGYDEDDSPSSEDHHLHHHHPHHHDFPSSGSTYQHSPYSNPYHHHPHHDVGGPGLGPGPSSNQILESSRFMPYGRDHPPSFGGFSYGPLGKSQRLAYEYPSSKRSYGPPASPPSTYDSVERTNAPYGFSPLGYNDYGSTSPI